MIGVDEHVWRHTRRGGKYVTVIIDLTPTRDKTGPARLLDMVEGRSKAAFKAWLEARLQAWKDRIEVVAMDGFTGFKTATTEALPGAVAVMDPFHVVRIAGDALDDCRRRIQQKLHKRRGRKDDPLYTARRTLHTGTKLLTERQRERLNALFAHHCHAAVEATWEIYQAMIAAYREPDRTRARTMIEKVIAALRAKVPDTLVELGKLGRTLTKRADDVLAFFDRPGTSNGPTEAINGRLEHLRGSALGFRNLTNYVARSLLFAGTMTTWESIVGVQQLWASLHVLVVLISISAILMAALLIGWMSSLAATVLCPLVGLWLSLVALNQNGLITIGSSSGSMLGIAPAWGSVAGQAITAVIVLAVGYAILASRRHPGGQLSWRAVGSAAIIVMLGVSGGLQLTPYRPTTASDSACYGDGQGGTRTCMSSQHERLLDPLDPLDQRFLEFQAAAAEVGAEDALPHTVVEDYTAHNSDAVQKDQRIGPEVPAWRPQSEELSAPDPRISRESLAHAFVDPSFCPQMQSSEGPSDTAFELADEGQEAALTMIDDSASMSDRSTAAERLKAIRSTLMSCDF